MKLTANDRARLSLVAGVSIESIRKREHGRRLRPSLEERLGLAAARLGLELPENADAPETRRASIAAGAGASFGDSPGPRGSRCATCGAPRGMLGNGTLAPCMMCSSRGGSHGGAPGVRIT